MQHRIDSPAAQALGSALIALFFCALAMPIMVVVIWVVTWHLGDFAGLEISSGLFNEAEYEYHRAVGIRLEPVVSLTSVLAMDAVVIGLSAMLGFQTAKEHIKELIGPKHWTEERYLQALERQRTLQSLLDSYDFLKEQGQAWEQFQELMNTEREIERYTLTHPKPIRASN